MQDKDILIKRLNRIEGQVKGIQKMLEEERYCIDILTQISAIRSAINKVGSIILENHIKGCVVNSIKEDNSEASIEELMKFLKNLKIICFPLSNAVLYLFKLLPL